MSCSISFVSGSYLSNLFYNIVFVTVIFGRVLSFCVCVCVWVYVEVWWVCVVYFYFLFYNALCNPINDLGCALGHIYRAPGEAIP